MKLVKEFTLVLFVFLYVSLSNTQGSVWNGVSDLLCDNQSCLFHGRDEGIEVYDNNTYL